MSVAVVIALASEAWACRGAGVICKGEGVDVVDLALRPRVEPMSALSMSADFASVRSSLDGLVLTWRAQIHATAILGVRARRGGSWASKDTEATILLIAVPKSS